MPLSYPTGKFAVLRQHHRRVYHSRQIDRSGVTPARLPRKGNSVLIKSGFIRSAAALALLDLAVTSRDGSGDVDG